MRARLRRHNPWFGIVLLTLLSPEGNAEDYAGVNYRLCNAQGECITPGTTAATQRLGTILNSPVSAELRTRFFEPMASIRLRERRAGTIDYLGTGSEESWPCASYPSRSFDMALSCLQDFAPSQTARAVRIRTPLAAALRAAGRTSEADEVDSRMEAGDWPWFRDLSQTLQGAERGCGAGPACQQLHAAANLAAGAFQEGNVARLARTALAGLAEQVRGLIPAGYELDAQFPEAPAQAQTGPTGPGGASAHAGGPRSGGRPGGGRRGHRSAPPRAQSQGQALEPDALSLAFAGLMSGRPAQGVEQHCPSVPAYYCGGGGSYDPAALTSRLPGDFHRTPLDTLSSQMYDLVDTDFKTDLQSWLLDLYVERYVELSAINGRLGDLNPVGSSALVQAGHACTSRLDTRVERAVAEVSEIPMDTARGNRRHELVVASLCAMQLMERERVLRHTLVLDRDIVIRPSGPGSRGEAVAEGLIGLIPTMPAFQYMMRHVPVLALDQGAREECSIPRLVPMLARNDPHWQATTYPFTPQALEEEIQGGRVRRNGNVIEEAIPRQVYCGNVAQEYVGVGHQFNQLMAAYPELGQNVGNRPMFQHLAELGGRRDCAAGDTSDYCRVRRYSLDPYRDTSQDPDRVNGQYPGGQRLSCMDLFRQPQETPAAAPGQPPARPLPPTYRINETQNAARFSEVDSVLGETGGSSVVGSQLSSLREQIGRLCENRDTVLTEAIRNPELMNRFFSCSSRSFGQLRDAAHMPDTTGAHELGGGPCRDRLNATWIACRMYEDARQSDENWAVAGELADLAFTALGTVTGMSNPVVSWGGARAFVVQTGIGAAAGAAFTYPQIRQMTAERDAAVGTQANFSAGLASYESFRDATTLLNRWAQSNPVVNEIITNVIIGAGTAALQTGGHAPSRDSAPHSADFIRSARRQRELIQLEGLYNDLLHDPRTGTNHFAGNPAAQQSLEHLIDDALRAESPELAANRPAFAALTSTPEGRMALLRERTSARNLTSEQAGLVSAAFDTPDLMDGLDPNTAEGHSHLQIHIESRRALQEALSNPDPAYDSLRRDFETLRTSMEQISDRSMRRRLLAEFRQRLLTCGV